MIDYVNYLIALIGITALWCSGGRTRSRRVGFALQIVNQAIWIVYGAATGQWGFVGGAVVFGTVAALNLWRLRGAKMNANDYQQLAARTLIDRPDAEYTGHELMMVWCALKLAGESGEIADHVGKGVFHRHGLDKEHLIKEIGDVLWYAAALCTQLDVSLSEVMEANIEKLLRRYPDGYSSAASIARSE